MSSSTDPMDNAIRNLGAWNTIRYGDRTLTIACLVRQADRRPLRASWWRKKEASIIGADLDGNFFLRHCEGSVRYWDHKTQTDTIIAPSVRDFLHQIGRV
jgi:hypothetical protein